tara:strand:+ start:640 stop:804 length:165 start_codon:yes stop_codon:yes gene_type:complete
MTMNLAQFREKEDFGDDLHTHYKTDEDLAKKIHQYEKKEEGASEVYLEGEDSGP